MDLNPAAMHVPGLTGGFGPLGKRQYEFGEAEGSQGFKRAGASQSVRLRFV